MSTPELLRADETHVVGRVGYLPSVNDERDEADEIARHGNPVQSRQLRCSDRLLLGRAAIFQPVQFFDLRREHVTGEQAERENSHEQAKRETTKGFPSVDHLRKKMSNGDEAANQVQSEITPDQMLRNQIGKHTSE